MRHTTRRRRTAQRCVAAVALAALLSLTGCSDSGNSWRGGNDSGKPDKDAATATVSFPAEGATDVPASAEIAFTTKNAASSAVALADADGERVGGAMRADGSTWIPDKQLKYGTRYTAKVTATAANGKASTKTVTFTTMPKPGRLVAIRSQLGDDLVYGVGMPVVINFSADVAKEERANVERRLFVTSEPAQEGIWNWFSAREIHFRPREYWRAGTKLTIRLATGGLPLGGGAYGATDVSIRPSIGPKLVMTVDNATKTMTVTKDDQVVKSMPVSLGKPSAPSSSGHMVIMVKNEMELFDSSTYGVPADSADGYRTKVQWPQRLTWGGQYVHAAPWSVADQGRRNVSHGCTNLSMENADWLWHETHLGDPVIVKGTERGLDWGDGWTDWDVPWEEYVKGSALPYGAPTPAASGSPSATPSPN